ncbi:MAG TPA: hypothetical protein VN494_11315 [Patescibacteria group bacterium]|nr:hypothetical protein [Patescibacteria group bacterium]
MSPSRNPPFTLHSAQGERDMIVEKIAVFPFVLSLSKRRRGLPGRLLDRQYRAFNMGGDIKAIGLEVLPNVAI